MTEQQPILTPKDVETILTILSEWFPAFVVEKHRPHWALKVGIDRDLEIRCPAITAYERCAALRHYTSRLMYLRSHIADAPRVDLDGNPAGAVTARQAGHAAGRIAGILASREAKRVAVKEAARSARIAIARAAREAGRQQQDCSRPPAAPQNNPDRSTAGRKILTLPAMRSH